MNPHPMPGHTMRREIDYFATRPSGVSLILAISCTGADSRQMEARVSPDERARAGRFRSAADRLLYVVARAGLRMVLGRILLSDATCLPLHFSSSGKPFLAEGPAFSVSHSGDVVLIGLAWQVQIGVDVEALRPLPDMESLATSVLAKSELAQLGRIQGVERKTRQLLSFWTRKEAVSKALGLGLALPFDSFSCLNGHAPHAISEGSAVNESRWTLMDLALPGPHVGAAALAGAAQRCVHVTADASSLLSAL